MLLIGVGASYMDYERFCSAAKMQHRILWQMNIQEVSCQGLQRHPFHGKDIVESVAGGTAGNH